MLYELIVNLSLLLIPRQLKKIIISFILISISVIQLKSQCTNPPNGVDCLCSTAQLLCTPDDLDGFTFSMSATLNQGGLPSNDLCPPINGIGGVPNNVNWFSFIAWCTDLTIDIAISNCSPGTDGVFNPSYGTQIGLFETCGAPWVSLDCVTEGVDACGGATTFPVSQSMSVTGLTIGNVYYFMLDGCAGSACDVTITIPQVCGTGTIDPWTTGLTGPLTSCVGNTETYTAEDVDGAVEFYYYLDGAPLIDGTELTSINQTWNAAGTYQLCVDVSNLPCIPESDDPPQNCIDIVVCDAAEAGTININTTPACPDETINFEVVGYTDTSDHDQYVIITSPSGQILEVNVGNTASYTSNMCESFKVFSYNLKTGSPPPTVSSFFPTDYPCLDNCCDSEESNFSFEDMMPPVFTSPPASTTLDCDALLDPMMNLDYTDNCIPDGSVAGTETGSSDPCAGGSITREWTVTDMCDNTTTHTQVITVNPLDPAVILNPPADITVGCTGVPTSAADLTYDNSLSGVCSIMGPLTPVYNDPADLCGGTNTFTWSTTDVCGRLIEHIQNIIVNPADPASYINPPGDMTFTCENKPTSFPDLMYTNSLSGACLIMNTVTPTVVDNSDICGGTITVMWSDIDPCGRPIEYTQTITIDPAPPSVYDNLPSNETVNCDLIPTSFPDLSHTNGVTGDCEISNTITPTVIDNADFCGGSITINWNDTDACSRAIDHQQIITVNPAPEAQFVNPPADITVNCDMAPSMAADLLVTNNEMGTCLISNTIPAVLSGNVNPCGSTLQFTWDFTDACGRPTSYTQNVVINPAPAPQFDAPPADLTVDCSNIPASNISLNYTNGETGNCAINGSELSTRSGTFDECGGSLIDAWSFTDQCGEVIVSSRSIQVNPAPAPIFVNPPADVTIDCADVPNIVSTIPYDNNETGICRIFGTVDAILSGSYDECGGQILQVYSYLDACGRPISHTRSIIVNPAPDPVFIDPPADVNLDCDVTYTPPSTLSYTNGLTGDCEIFGAANLVSVTTGITTTNEWTFIHPCTNAVITHTQTVTGFTPANIMLNPDFVEICVGQSFDLSQITFFDFNNNVASVSYHTDFPTNTTNEITNTIVSPTSQTIYIVSAKTAENCETVEPFIIFVVDGSDAGEDITDEVCLDNTTTDLFSFLDPSTVQDGFWLDLDLNGVDLSDATNVNLNSLTDGLYNFYYLTNPSGSCPSDTALLSLNIVGEIPYQIADLDCSSDQMSYSFSINVSPEITVNSSQGTVTNSSPGVFIIDAIDISQSTDIDLSSSIHNCPQQFTVNPPNCNCPNINPPLGDDDFTVCLNDLPLALMVTVEAGLEANWYDSASSTTALASGINNYTFNESSAGLYSLFVEAIDPITMCTSIDRLQIDIEIVGEPVVSDFLLEECDDDTDGLLEYDLEDIKSMLSNNPNLSFSIFASQTDAENLNGELNGLYTTLISSDTLYVLSTNNAGCTSISLIFLNVLSLPTANIVVNNENCENANDGIVFFNDISVSDYTLFFMGTDQGNAIEVDSLAPGSYNYIIIDDNLCQAVGTVDIEAAAQISITSVDTDCSNASTETDPSDDFYTIELLVETSTSSTGYELIEGTNNLGQFDYNTLESFLFNADGNSYVIYIQDLDNQCLDSIQIGPLFPCSTDCVIEIDALNSECMDNGTDLDPTDDFYTVDFNLSAINGGANQKYQVLQNNTIIGVFDYGIDVSITLPADGTNTSLVVIDLDDNQCSISLDLGVLDPCSNNCSLNLLVNSSICSQNNTSEEVSDDFFVTNIIVSENNTNNVDFTLELDGISQGVFSYDMAFDINIPADNQTHTLRAIDTNNDQCFDELITEILEPCSAPCIDTAIASVSNKIDCNNTTAILSLMGTSTIASYSWVFQGSEISTMPSVEVGNAGIYNVEVTFANGCTANDAIEVEKDDDIPTADPGPDVLLNCTLSTITLGGGMTSIGSQFDYEWTDAFGTIISTDISFTTSDTGIYFLQVIDNVSLCESSIESIQVSANYDIPSVLILANPGDILDCVIASIILESPNEPDVSYVWQQANGEPSTLNNLTINIPGTYTLVATNLLSECIDSSTITILDFEDYPNANLTANADLDCVTDQVNISSDFDSSIGSFLIEWLDGNNNPIIQNQDSINVQSPGWYYISITDLTNGCSNIDSIEVLENINEFDLMLSSSINVIAGETTVLNLSTSIPEENIGSIEWMPADGLSCIDCLTPTATVSEDQLFNVIVTDIFGCTSEASINLVVEERTNIFTPNVFHPNSENTNNQKFTIFSSDNDAIILEIKIYDRWGNNVYANSNLSVNDPSIGWDGTFKGQPVVPGVYVYFARLLLSDGQEEILSSDVTVLF